jgi:hypothetical protein
MNRGVIMDKTFLPMESFDFSRWDKHIVFAPNGTGKTRLSGKINESLLDEKRAYLTSKSILGLASKGRNDIKVGNSSAQKVENEGLEKTLNKQSNLKPVFQSFGVEKASDFKTNGYFFSKHGISNAKLIDAVNLIGLTTIQNGHSEFLAISNDLLPLEKCVKIDSCFHFSDFSLLNGKQDELAKIFENATDRTHWKTDEEMKAIETIKNGLRRGVSCPLCGSQFNSHKDLLDAIDANIKSFVSVDNKVYFDALERISDSAEKARKIWPNFPSAGTTIPEQYNFYLNFSNAFHPIEIVILNYLYEICSKDGKITDYQKYKANEAVIKKDEEESEVTPAYFDEVIRQFKAIVSMPTGFELVCQDDGIRIQGEDKKTIKPDDFFSDSELRRLCLGVLAAEIKYRHLSYLILDDPVDSCDDYYFASASSLIGKTLKDNQGLHWVIFTHEYRLSCILSNYCIVLDENDEPIVEKNGWVFEYFLPDPFFNKPKTGSSNRPPLNSFVVSPIQNQDINEHEIIIFSKIFSQESGYECDPELALLASFGQFRNFYKKMFIKTFQGALTNDATISTRIKDLQKSYLHFGPASASLTFGDLEDLAIDMYQKYQIQHPSPLDRKSVLVQRRAQYLSTSRTPGANNENPLLNHILILILRVTKAKYDFEEKLVSLCRASGVQESMIKKMVNTAELGNKIPVFCGFPEIQKTGRGDVARGIYERFRSLINDFEHSTERMYPPFLTCSPQEISNLEGEIASL